MLRIQVLGGCKTGKAAAKGCIRDGSAKKCKNKDEKKYVVKHKPEVN